MTEPQPNPPPPDPPPDLTDPATQKALVKSGCLTVLTWIGLIAAFLAVYYSAGPLVEKGMAPPPGPDTMVFGCAHCIGRQAVVGSLFAALLLLAAVGILKRFVPALLATCAIVAIVVYWNFYYPYTALTYQRDSVVLHYLWPRPSIVIKNSDIIQTDVELTTQVRGEGGSDFRYALQIKTKTDTYVSMDEGLDNQVQAAIRRIGKRRQ